MVAQVRALVVKEDRTAKPDAPCRGSLLIVRLNKLEAMNKRVGHETVDRMLAWMPLGAQYVVAARKPV